MDWLKPYLVSRVRVKALAAMIEAGGEPSTGAIHRAIAPVLGDLLPLPRAPRGSAADRQKALERFVELTAEDVRRSSLGPSCDRRAAVRGEKKL